MYCVGAIKNCELRPVIYPDWTIVIYHDDTVPSDVLKKLKELKADLRKFPCRNGLFSRFAIADDPKVEAFIIRDTDSRIGEREAGAVKEWLASTKCVHLICDHPHHTPVISGGLWGARHGAIKGIQKLIAACPSSSLESDRKVSYNSDQIWLRDVIWPLVKDDILIHDLCFHAKRQGAVPFPSKFGQDRFVGEVFDQHDKPRGFDFQMRTNWQEA